MIQPEIASKLKWFLDLHNSLSEECHAVYILVEARKLLDLNGSGKDFPLLRFYCDWALHTQKDRHLEHIAPIITRMYESIRKELQSRVGINKFTDEIISFMYFKELRQQMASFLERNGLPTQLTLSDTLWHSFVKLTVQVLSDQPIIKPIEAVEQFLFEPSGSASVRGRLDFAYLIHGADGKKYSRYTFVNSY